MFLISCFGDLGLVPFAFFPVASFRWGSTRGCCARVEPGAPSTPGGLGYLATEQLMDLGRVYFFQFLGLCFEGFSVLSVSGDLRANVGTGRKMPSVFII